MRLAISLVVIVLLTSIPATTQTRPRGRDLGIPFPGQTGPANAITDVAGIAVGHVTLIEGEGIDGQGFGGIINVQRAGPANTYFPHLTGYQGCV